MNRRGIASALLIVVLVFGVIASGCIGGGNNTKTTQTTSATNTVVNKVNATVTIPDKVSAKDYVLDFSVKVRTASKIKKVIATLVVDGKTYPLDAKLIGEANGEYVFELTHSFPPGTKINADATINVNVVYETGQTYAYSKTIHVTVLPPVHKVGISFSPKYPEIQVSQVEETPLVLIMTVSSDAKGKVVIGKVSDSKGYVTGVSGFNEFNLPVGKLSYYVTLTYNASKVLSNGGGEDTITISGYYYTYDNPGEKFKFEKTVSVTFAVKKESIDFSAFNGVTVLNTAYLYDPNASYGLVMVKVVVPTGFAKVVKMRFSVSTENISTPFNGITNTIVAVNGEVNYTDAFNVFEEKGNSPEVVVPENNTVVTLLIKAEKLNLTEENVAELISEKFYLVSTLEGAMTQDGQWVYPEKPVVAKTLVGIMGIANVENKGCSCNSTSCEVNTSGFLAGISELYTVSNPFPAEEGVLYIAYPYPGDKNQTVRVTLNLPPGLKFAVSEVPLYVGDLSALIELDALHEGNATLYLEFGNEVTLHRLYFYVLPGDKPLPQSISMNLTISTQGTNGMFRDIHLSYSKLPKFELAFVYFGNTQPTVSLAKAENGVVLSPFDDAYLSWYAGANVLFNYGVPANVSKTFYIPVVFIAPKPYGNYYVKILPIASEPVKMKPLATLGEGVIGGKATAYYATVKVMASNPIGFYPIVIEVIDGSGKVVSVERTYLNSEVLSYLNQYDISSGTNSILYASAVLDSFVEENNYRYWVAKLSSYVKTNESTAKNIYVSNGVLYAFNGKTPEYALELGYFVFNFSKADQNVTAEFVNGFTNVSTYADFQRVILTAKSTTTKMFGVNVLFNPSNLSFVKLNPGDEKRVINVAFMLPVSRNKTYTVREVMIEGNELHYITIKDGVMTDKTEDPNFPLKSDSGYYLVVPNKGRYVVGGYEFVNTSETLPFIELKVIYVPSGEKYDLTKLGVSIDGKQAKVVWDKEGITEVLEKYYKFAKNATPSVIVKPYGNYLVLDIYAPADFVRGGNPLLLSVTYGGRLVLQKRLSANDVAYLTFLNLFDAGLLPDFGFYTFDWLQPIPPK